MSSATDSTPARLPSELVGVHHADGGIIGDVRFALGTVTGRAHCALRDVTHAMVRRKPEWDAMVARLGVPVRLLHLNELDADVRRAVGHTGSPVVFGRYAGHLVPLLRADGLAALRGSVAAFEEALVARMSAMPAMSRMSPARTASGGAA